MIKVQFATKAKEDYDYWRKNDNKILVRIQKLLNDINMNGNMKGIGKPEALKHDLSGYYSRRIDQTHRLVYKQDEDGIIIILQCRYHYSK